MDLASLSQKALEHGLGSVEDNLGPLIPFTLVVDESNPDPTERRIVLTRFAAEYLEESLQQAQSSIVPAPGIARYAIARDGYVTAEGRNVGVGNPMAVGSTPSRLWTGEHST